ncbi:MAG: STING domain-containing protein [Bacteroidota bacterium]
MHVIMPDNLKASSMNSALKKMRVHRKGDIISKGAKRNFGINFRFDGPDKIIILDFPKPLNAIREHLMREPQFVGMLGGDGKMKGVDILNSEAWRKAEQEELENFKATIYGLMDRARMGEDHSIISFININDIPPEK